MPIVTTEASCLVLAAVTAMVVLRSKTSAACLGRKTTVVQMEGGALRLRAKLGLGPVGATEDRIRNRNLTKNHGGGMA